MTTNAADINPPVIETNAMPPVLASSPVLAPSPVMPRPSPVPLEASGPGELETRVMARRAEMIAKLGEIKTDTRLESVELRDKLKAKLSELAHILKEGVVDGWANLGEAAKLKLDHWLAS